MNDELLAKIIIWKKELEKQNVNIDTMTIFDNMCNYLEEQQKEIYNLRNNNYNKKLNGKVNQLSKERVGEVRKNNNGSLMELVRYEGSNNIYVKFEKGEPIKTSYGNFLKGKVKNPFEKSVYKIGYLGQGKYNAYINGNKQSSQYSTWKNMIYRCYDDKFLKANPTYKDCTVIEEWHNFQNFGKWFDENYYEIEGEQMHLDKDILLKGNKIYSPDTCIFVPKRINMLFVKSNATRNNLPIGVGKYFNKYVVQAENGEGKTNYIGIYDTINEAFNAYKQFKERHIKNVAEEYKGIIPEKLYEAMIAYEVNIND